MANFGRTPRCHQNPLFDDSFAEPRRNGIGDDLSGSRGALVIYLDTSARVKLYLLKTDSHVVQELIAAQHAPLPVWMNRS